MVALNLHRTVLRCAYNFSFSSQLLFLFQVHIHYIIPNSDTQFHWKARPQGFNEINKVVMLNNLERVLMHDNHQIIFFSN
jgi:hypothetical protein